MTNISCCLQNGLLFGCLWRQYIRHERLFCDSDDELSEIESSNIFRHEPQKLWLVQKVEASALQTDKLLGGSNPSSRHSIPKLKTKIFRKGTLTGKNDQGNCSLAFSSVF